jgi:hypothetical protein
MAIDFEADMSVFFSADEFGLSASYEPTPGTPVACVVLVDARDDTTEIGGARFVAGQRIVSVRKSQLADPAKGGIFAVTRRGGGVDRYVVTAKPKTEDPDGLVWTCLCDPE